MGKDEEIEQLDFLFENLFDQLDADETWKLIEENIKYYGNLGYDVSKYRTRAIKEFEKMYKTSLN